MSAKAIIMLLLTLVVVVALVFWALRLMEQAIQSQEFSFMLAGFLVASSAAAMMAVYFLMSHYVVYMDRAITAVAPDAYLFSDEGTYAYVQQSAEEMPQNFIQN